MAKFANFWRKVFKLELVEILKKEYLSLVLGLAQFNSTGLSPGLEPACGHQANDHDTECACAH
jgi:hypothetical protein